MIGTIRQTSPNASLPSTRSAAASPLANAVHTATANSIVALCAKVRAPNSLLRGISFELLGRSRLVDRLASRSGFGICTTAGDEEILGIDNPAFAIYSQTLGDDLPPARYFPGFEVN